MSKRPDLNLDLTAAEFRRWYWLKEELSKFARTLDISTTGNKAELAARIDARLDGRPIPASTPRRRRAEPLVKPLTGDTVVPFGQTASVQLRPFFVNRIGPSFRFDQFMRDFLATSNGATLNDAVDHWYATRGAATRPTPESLEYVRFTREWHRAHPDGTAAACRNAWRRHRSLPIDERPGPTAP